MPDKSKNKRNKRKLSRQEYFQIIKDLTGDSSYESLSEHARKYDEDYPVITREQALNDDSLKSYQRALFIDNPNIMSGRFYQPDRMEEGIQTQLPRLVDIKFSPYEDEMSGVEKMPRFTFDGPALKVPGLEGRTLNRVPKRSLAPMHPAAYRRITRNTR